MVLYIHSDVFCACSDIDTTTRGVRKIMNNSAVIVIPQLKTNYSTNETFKCAQICEFASALTESLHDLPLST